MLLRHILGFCFTWLGVRTREKSCNRDNWNFLVRVSFHDHNFYNVIVIARLFMELHILFKIDSFEYSVDKIYVISLSQRILLVVSIRSVFFQGVFQVFLESQK